jgi:hypothetical protein
MDWVDGFVSDDRLVPSYFSRRFWVSLSIFSILIYARYLVWIRFQERVHFGMLSWQFEWCCWLFGRFGQAFPHIPLFT